MREPRRSQMVDFINREGYVTFAALKSLFPDVSEMTLRTDLRCLDQEGRIIRMHGGARSIETVVRLDDVYYKKVNRNVEKKQQIARKALQLIQPGQSIFIDCGSTLMQFAKLLPDEPMFIVTNNVSCAYDIARLSQPEILVLGGYLKRLNMSTSDPQNAMMLMNYNFDVSFYAASAYSVAQGFTSPIAAVDERRKVIVKRSKKNVVLIDSSKIGRVFPIVSYPLEDIHVVISDDAMPEEAAEDFRSRGIEVL